MPEAEHIFTQPLSGPGRKIQSAFRQRRAVGVAEKARIGRGRGKFSAARAEHYKMTHARKLYAARAADGNTVKPARYRAHAACLGKSAHNKSKSRRVENGIGYDLGDRIKYAAYNIPLGGASLSHVKVARSFVPRRLFFQSFVYVEIAQKLVCRRTYLDGAFAE